jgi:SulP family sulfate permease
LKVSFVGILETLISARIADNLTGTRFDQSLEVRGLAVSNLVCGLLGATPCTGVLVRTAVNISSGATFKISQFINGVVVLIVIFFLLPCFSYIPMPVIASILITSACKLVPKKIIAHLFHLDKFECFILLFTATLCVFVDGAFGLMIGGVVTLLVNASKIPL